jgi:asparagine synthase (glutamine-hydrolysing)
MCGIAGFVSKRFNQDHLKSITAILAHRGPDADGFFYEPNAGIGLGHRRLSILDLSAAANQPFYSRDGRYIMIFNGEVYNFREVAEKYQIQSRTSSDSEIIIEAFALYGIDCVNDFNGMFAIAIWDTKEETLYLIRDRIGVKPLYYYFNNDDLAFASELKALFSLPVPKTINRNGISDFLYLGYIPGEDTIYKECRKLKPGHFAIYKKGNLSIQPYWDIAEKIYTDVLTDEHQAKNTLKRLIASSVKYCMISDVPVGIFLSGGIDSSMVAAAAQSVSSEPVKTFSIGFREKKYNEAHFADEVARYFNQWFFETIIS